MKRCTVSIALMGLVIGLFSGPAWTQDKDDSQIVVKGSIVAGAQAVGETERSSKFTEYRDVPKGFFLEYLNMDLTHGSHYFYLSAIHVQQADERVIAGAGNYGNAKLDLGYDKIPHRFSFFGATPYVENTPGIFTLNDVIRSGAAAP